MASALIAFPKAMMAGVGHVVAAPYVPGLPLPPPPPLPPKGGEGGEVEGEGGHSLPFPREGVA